MRCTGRSLMPYLYNSSFDISSRVVFKDKATEIFQRRPSRDPVSGMLFVPYYPYHRCSKIKLIVSVYTST